MVKTTSPSYQAPVRGKPARSPVQRTDDGKTRCIPKIGSREEVLEANIDYVWDLDATASLSAKVGDAITQNHFTPTRLMP
nr:O-glycosyl hydrolases family 17 protein [Tanacetum cinerariifolium]